MTENEAIKSIEHDLEWHSKELQPKYKEVLRFAIKTLEEIQQYRALGTVEELESLKSTSELWEHNNHLAYRQGRKDAIDEFARRMQEWNDKIEDIRGKGSFACFLMSDILKVAEGMKSEEE